MLTRRACRRLAAASLAAALLLPGATVPRLRAQPQVAAACRETCPDPARFPAEAAACLARQQVCQSKLALYQTYMAQLGAGVPTHRLPQVYIDVLRPSYPGVDLAAWRFGFGDRQPPNNATTDCGTTYYNNAAFVGKLRTGALDTSGEFGWLFHELGHVGQCRQLGSRDLYAKMWFAHLELAFLQNADLKTLHDRMPMEADASGTAIRVREATVANRDRDNHLVMPIQLALRAGSSPVGDQLGATVGTPVRLTALPTGGSVPISVEWQLKLPNATLFGPVRSTVADFEFLPDRAGTYEVSVRAFQDQSRLEPAHRVVKVPAQQPARIPTDALNDRPAVAAASGIQRRLTRTLTVTLKNAAGAAVAGTLCAGDSSDLARFGRMSAGPDGRAVFQVMRGAGVRVTASAPGFIGRSVEVGAADADAVLSVVLTRGIGGAVCQ